MNDRLLLVLVLICLGLALFVLVLTLVLHAINGLRDKSKVKLTERLEDLLTDFLSTDENLSKSIALEIKGLTRSKRKKNILIDLLLKLCHNFSGYHGDRTYDLYENLGLHRFSLQKLKSRKWHQKVRGMYELSTLEYEESFDEIAKFINHPVGAVRRNARIALIKVRKKKALMALKDLKGSMSTWTYINIIATLKRNPVKLSEEEMHALKNAENKYIRLLSKELESTVYVR